MRSNDVSVLVHVGEFVEVVGAIDGAELIADGATLGDIEGITDEAMDGFNGT